MLLLGEKICLVKTSVNQQTISIPDCDIHIILITDFCTI